MSDPAANTYLSWMRRGLGASVSAAETVPHALATVTVRINNDGLQAEARLPLLGPGEISGFDARVVIRTWPKAGDGDAESNYFPLVEFAHPDLPWLYTPATADGQDRLLPWLCLIALKDGEFVRQPPGPDRPLPWLSGVSPAVLPNLEQAWAWTHIQIAAMGGVYDPDDAWVILRSEPRRLISRLLCPRKLDSRTRYTAFVVPVFERGRLAGLGEAVENSVTGLARAWAESDPVDLPIYFEWSFQTGAGGDFEYLVSLLKARELPPAVGVRPLDVANPGGNLPGATSGVLGVEGALKAVNAGSTWGQTEREAWTGALRKLVNQPQEALGTSGSPPIVAPPLYGRWHAARRTLESVPSPPWFDDLNADPRLRVAAGLGTHVVQEQQRQLLAGAWDQVEQIRMINERLRFAQLAREAAAHLHQRDLAAVDIGTAIQLATPLHSRVRGPDGLTVHGLLRTSAIGIGVLEPQFRRLARVYGPIGRRQGRPSRSRDVTLFQRLNDGVLQPARLPRDSNRFAHGFREAGLIPGRLSADGGGDGFIPIEAPQQPDDPPARRPESDDEVSARFRTALQALFGRLNDRPARGERFRKLDLRQIRDVLVDGLDPRTTIPASFTGRLSVAERLDWSPVDPLEPIMAAPAFPEPMFKPLRDLSQDWVLPGLDQVPENTVALLISNQRFIEAYLVGLNHEMARELLWHEYPTDQRGTYFRQFWDPAGFVAPPGETVDPELLRDIAPIPSWGTRSLGDNSSRPPLPNDDEQLVLLVRGELLRRYPTAVVFAVRAELRDGARVPSEDRDQQRYPVFSGSLQPDVSFFGFALSVQQALGQDGAPDNEHGWFFVLQEQAAETIFGLNDSRDDDLSAWDKLAWTDATVSDGGHIDLASASPDVSTLQASTPQKWHIDAGARAADIAWITRQLPVRVAIHASDMLP